MASFIYQKGLHALGAGGDLNIETANLADEIYLMLLTSAYAPDQGTHNNVEDVRANEINAGGGYSVDGKLYTNGSIEVHRDNVAMTDQIEFQSPVVWSAATISAAYAVTYQKVTDDTDSPLLFLWDFGGTRVTNGTDFVVSWKDTIAHIFGPCPAS